MALRGWGAGSSLSWFWGPMSVNEMKRMGAGLSSVWRRRRFIVDMREHRQGHLEESRVYMAGRLNEAIWERERDGRVGTKSGTLQPRGKRGMVAKMADIVGHASWEDAVVKTAARVCFDWLAFVLSLRPNSLCLGSIIHIS